MFTKKPFRNKRVVISVLVAAGIIFFSGTKLFLDRIYVPVILMYHSVGEKTTALDGYGPKLSVSRDAFQKQMRFLSEWGYRVISLEEFIERIKAGKKIPARTVAITFDDGLKNNFTDAYPILKEYGFPATIFVITDSVEKEKFLTWNDISIMQENNISMGSHTASHAWLPDLDEMGLFAELLGSKAMLENRTGKSVKTLSYPLGGFNDKVKDAARKLGYIGAVATNPGPAYPARDPYALKRIRISMTSNNLFSFWIETSGYYTFIKEIRDEY